MTRDARRPSVGKPGAAFAIAGRLIGAFAALLVTAGAAGQVESSASKRPVQLSTGSSSAAQDPSGPALLADFGWAGHIPADRWAPITVWVSSGDSALSGWIEVAFDQDSTQGASISVPFSTTPGRQVPVQVIATLPPSVAQVTFTMRDERSSRLMKIEYATRARGQQAQLPETLSAGSMLFAAVGETSLPESIRSLTTALGAVPFGEAPVRRYRVLPRRQATEADANLAWRNAVVARTDVAILPVAWTGYDGLTALVVRADAATTADPRAIEAVRTWVQSGGRLVILGAAAGDQWRAWLPSGEPGELVTLGPVEDLPVPGDVERALTRAVVRGSDAPGPSPPEQPVTPARSAPVRAMRLTERAADAGWSLRWSVGDGSGALAEGPVGFGWVTILGVEPRMVTQTLSAQGSALVWQDALRLAIADSIREGARAAIDFDVGSYESHVALESVLERLGRVPVAGGLLFVVIAGSMAMLALLVGPIDYFALKRFRANHRSWLTALGWIGLASCVAYAAPIALRTAPTQVNRFTVIDRFVDAARPTGSAAWQTGLTGIYASESGFVTFRSPDPASWWRGVSAAWYTPYDRPLGSAVAMRQVDSGDGARGCALQGLGLGLWTFRTFLDQSRPFVSATASISVIGEEREVTLAGLPEGVHVKAVACRTGRDWFIAPPPGTPAPPDAGGVGPMDGDPLLATDPPTIATPTGGACTVRTVRFLPERAEDAPAAWGVEAMSNHDVRYYSDHGPSADVRPGLAYFLPGARERTLAIERLLASGRWAAVYAYVTDWPTDTPIDRDARYERLVVLRLLLPLDPSQRVPEATDEPPVPARRSRPGPQPPPEPSR